MSRLEKACGQIVAQCNTCALRRNSNRGRRRGETYIRHLYTDARSCVLGEVKYGSKARVSCTALWAIVVVCGRYMDEVG